MGGIVAVLALLLQADPARDAIEFFEKKIRPLLVERCYACHSAQAAKVKGELFLDSREGLLRGGESGAAIVPGDPEKSRLIQAVRYTHEDFQMPPKAKDRLTPEQVADFVSWVKMGAPDPRAGAAPPPKSTINFDEARKFWSFQPVKAPAAAEGIDGLIQAKLAEKGLKPSPPADRRTLIRRATFDLIGLPPAPEEVEAFVKDPSPDAFAKVVDRLLASPHYGERWGRHWLDVVRYADTAGDNSDYPIPQVYRYRDYVIQSFNHDKPYDQFLREQLAGDLLPSASEAERQEKIVATGYLAISRRFGSQINGYPQHLTIEDTIDNLGRAMLGLTVSCARCHDHKFDPITNDDYYALYGIFNSTRYPFPGIELEKRQRDLVPLLPAAQVEEIMKPYRGQLAAFDAEIQRLEAERTAVRKEVEGIDAEAERRRRADQLKKAIAQARKRHAEFLAKVPPIESAYAVAEGASGNARVQIKGEPRNLGLEVPRRFLEVLGGRELPAGFKGSGRLQLAEWIADAGNPLTARVMANRIWQHHFGRGLVRTASDFGSRGTPPTHPELLDYLAARFIEGDPSTPLGTRWSIKSMHRLIMLTRTYQQSSRETSEADPENDLLARFSRRRLDAESIRDAMLAVSGALDRTPGGAHPFPPQTTWEFTQHVPFNAVYESSRRSVYVMQQRIRKHPFFMLFDGADTNASTSQRTSSTTPLQALFMMNDRFVHAQAENLVARLRRAGADDGARIEAAWPLLFGRPPTPMERAAGEDYLRRMGERLKAAGTAGDQVMKTAWMSYARVLLSLNEFIFVD